MIKRRLALLALEGVLLLTACGQAKDNSALTMPPLDAVQSAAQVIESAGDNAQEDTANLPAEETAEEAKPADGEETPKLAEDAEKPSAKAEETPPAPTGEEQPDSPEKPTTPEQAVPPAPQPEPAPSEPEPTPAPVQEPEPVPAPEPEPEPELEYEPADRWAAVETANAYAATQYDVTTDSSLTMSDSAYRFPASVAADASQETLEAKARDMADYTFRQLMMQAGVDTLADAGIRCNVCIVEDGASLLIYVLYAG